MRCRRESLFTKVTWAPCATVTLRGLTALLLLMVMVAAVGPPPGALPGDGAVPDPVQAAIRSATPAAAKLLQTNFLDTVVPP